MRYEVITDSGMGNFSFEANNEQELAEKLLRVEKVIKSNRDWYKFVNQVIDEKGNYICQW